MPQPPRVRRLSEWCRHVLGAAGGLMQQEQYRQRTGQREAAIGRDRYLPRHAGRRTGRLTAPSERELADIAEEVVSAERGAPPVAG